MSNSEKNNFGGGTKRTTSKAENSRNELAKFQAHFTDEELVKLLQAITELTFMYEPKEYKAILWEMFKSTIIGSDEEVWGRKQRSEFVLLYDFFSETLDVIQSMNDKFTQYRHHRHSN